MLGFGLVFGLVTGGPETRFSSDVRGLPFLLMPVTDAVEPFLENMARGALDGSSAASLDTVPRGGL